MKGGGAIAAARRCLLAQHTAHSADAEAALASPIVRFDRQPDLGSYPKARRWRTMKALNDVRRYWMCGATNTVAPLGKHMRDPRQHL